MGIDVAGRLEHHEQAVAVVFELRPLVCVDGVFDSQGMEVESLRDGGELLGGRLVQADPDEAAADASCAEGVVEVERLGGALTVLIHGTVDDHDASLATGLRTGEPTRRTAVASSRRSEVLPSTDEGRPWCWRSGRRPYLGSLGTISHRSRYATSPTPNSPKSAKPMRTRVGLRPKNSANPPHTPARSRCERDR